MEKKDVITCPSYDAQNEKSRATCQVCHTPLYKTKEVGKPKGVAREPKKVEEKVKINLGPPITPPPPIAKITNLDPFTSKQIPKEPTGSPTGTEPVVESKSRKRRVEIQKRKPRRKSKVPAVKQYFMLDGKTLKPVVIGTLVKPIRKSLLDTEATMLIDIWNCNKSLLQK